MICGAADLIQIGYFALWSTVARIAYSSACHCVATVVTIARVLGHTIRGALGVIPVIVAKCCDFYGYALTNRIKYNYNNNNKKNAKLKLRPYLVGTASVRLPLAFSDMYLDVAN